jgi:ubiquinone/menaquinone biosynthesis C-methylase UbiE
VRRGITVSFENVYGDSERAAAYAKLEFPGTYYLAYRDLPLIIKEHVTGKSAVDFGCGTGRSTRFLRNLGFDAVGVDISEEMVQNAREMDSDGSYHVIGNADLSPFRDTEQDLVLSAFTFDNIPTEELKMLNLSAIRGVLRPGGVMINLVSSPEIYVNEWASFTTRDFPENRNASSGDPVKIVMKDVEDSRPVEDVLYTDESYRDIYQRSGLRVLKAYRPLAEESEPFDWISETTIAPWVIYVLQRP